MIDRRFYRFRLLHMRYETGYWVTGFFWGKRWCWDEPLFSYWRGY